MINDALTLLAGYIHQFIDIMLHLDMYLNQWIAVFGPWIYVILFLVIFCETGLVVTPFLPGDSLLFALGALCASTDAVLKLPLLAGLLISAAILGDTVNYFIGRYVGPKIFHKEDSVWLNKAHLNRAHEFYEKYGGKTIIMCQYMPIIRTFAPFVAGIGKMTYRKFAVYNVIGAVSWILIFLLAGYHFGNIPSVKRNFHVVIFTIIFISVIPIFLEYYKARKARVIR